MTRLGWDVTVVTGSESKSDESRSELSESELSASELSESKSELSESRSGSGKVSCISAIDRMGSHAISQRSKLVGET